MKVSELITLLLGMPQDALVATYDEVSEDGGLVKSVRAHDDENPNALYFKSDSPHKIHNLPSDQVLVFIKS